MTTNPSFHEDHISQVPALHLLQNLGYTYLRPQEVILQRKGRVSGCIKLWSGPRAVPARSGPDGSQTAWSAEPPGVVPRAASRDSSRSGPELEAGLGARCEVGGSESKRRYHRMLSR